MIGFTQHSIEIPSHFREGAPLTQPIDIVGDATGGLAQKNSRDAWRLRGPCRFDDQRSPRAVVLGKHSGREQTGVFFGAIRSVNTFCNFDAENFLNLLCGDRAGTQNSGSCRIGEIHNGRLDADGARTAIEDRGNFPIEPIEHMRGGRWTDIAEQVGTRRSKRNVRQPEQPSR